jgi:hypothetical protein
MEKGGGGGGSYAFLKGAQMPFQCTQDAQFPNNLPTAYTDGLGPSLCYHQELYFFMRILRINTDFSDQGIADVNAPV